MYDPSCPVRRLHSAAYHNEPLVQVDQYVVRRDTRARYVDAVIPTPRTIWYDTSLCVLTHLVLTHLVPSPHDNFAAPSLSLSLSFSFSFSFSASAFSSLWKNAAE